MLPFSPPPLIHKLFRSWKSSETQHTRVPLRNSSVLRDKNFSIENRDLPLLGIKFFDTRNFLKGSSTKCFDTVRQNKFDGTSWYPPTLIPNIFRYQNFSETQKGSSSKYFDTVRQNNFDGKSWYPPPLLSPKFFDTRNFLKHRRVPLRSFSALWDKNFPTENRDTL